MVALGLLVLACALAPAPALLPPQPRHWFLRAPSAPGVARFTTTITATRVLTEVHLSSCLVPADLPACPPARGEEGPAPPFRLASDAGEGPDSASLRSDHYTRPAVVGVDPRGEARTFSGLQSMIMQLLHPSSATPPLPRTPLAADGPVTRTVFVTRRSGAGVPTSTSTVSFTLSGCVPSHMPFPLDPCEDGGVSLRAAPAHGASVRPTALPEAPSEEMLEAPASELLLGTMEEEESGSGAHGE